MQSVLLDTEPKGETRLVDTLHEVAERVSQRALIVVLSDLFCPPGELQEAFQHLRYRKHDVVAWQLMERDELEFRFERTTRFVDLEGGASIVADPASIGDRYLRALEAEDGAAALRAWHDELSPEEEAGLREYLEAEGAPARVFAHLSVRGAG